MNWIWEDRTDPGSVQVTKFCLTFFESSSLFLQKGSVRSSLTSSNMNAAAAGGGGELLPTVFGQNEHFSISPGRNVLLLRSHILIVPPVGIVSLESCSWQQDTQSGGMWALKTPTFHLSRLTCRGSRADDTSTIWHVLLNTISFQYKHTLLNKRSVFLIMFQNEKYVRMCRSNAVPPTFAETLAPLVVRTPLEVGARLFWKP